MRRAVRAILTVAAVGTVAVLGWATAAQAHVTVDPTQATQGGYARLLFRVPTESDTLSTTKVEVALPTDTPFASVLTLPVTGWTVATTKAKLTTPITNDDGDTITEAVSTITWTASSNDSAIKPGEFLEFPVDVGPLPKASSVVFKTLQTYSDGSIVRWIDLAAPGQAEPDHPAPVLTLTADPGTSAAPTTGATRASNSSSNGNSGAALTVAIIGALLALAALVVGILALQRSRRPSGA
jgi:uncharacterized protein YcnI